MPACDLLIYGSTLAGIFAGIRAVRDAPGLSVVIVAPNGRRGGMVTGGLTISDVVVDAVYWGLTREFAVGIGSAYGKPTSSANLTWKFEAHKAASVLTGMIGAASGLTFVDNQQVAAVQHSGATVTSVTLSDGAIYTAATFVDASYDADLLRLARCSMSTGREASSTYGESEAGYNAVNLTVSSTRTVDLNGDRLAIGGSVPPRVPGMADRRAQSMNFRMQITNDPARKMAWPLPPGYNRDRAASECLGLARTFEQVIEVVAVPDAPNKFQTNHNDIVGDLAAQWLAATSHAAREALKARIYLRFMEQVYFRANDPVVPQAARDSFNSYGLSSDEFQTDYYHVPGMSPEIYVRDCRRLIGQYVGTALDAETNAILPDPICVGGYFMDSHTMQSFPRTDAPGAVVEGHTKYNARQYYSIALRSIKPHAGQALNLLAAWPISVSRMLWCSARMEQTLSMVGEVAGMLAALAKQTGIPVGLVTYAQLQPRLLTAGAITRYVP